MDPGQEKLDRNRGVALWNNLVISLTALDGRVIATDKETGKSCGTRTCATAGDSITAAPLALKDTIIVGGSGGDSGVRCWIASLDAKTGEMNWKTYAMPAPGEPGSETWKDKANAWQTGGGAFYVTGSYDPRQPHLLGLGQPGAGLRLGCRPGDNLFTNSPSPSTPRPARSPGTSVHAERQPRLRRGRHADPDRRKVSGEDRKMLSHADRNGFNYTLDRGTASSSRPCNTSRR